MSINWQAAGPGPSGMIKAVKNTGSAENVRAIKQAIEIASFLIPATSAASAVTKTVKVASKAVAKANNMASRANVAKAYRKAEKARKIASAGGSIAAEERAGNAAIKAAYRAVKQAENARVFARTAGKAANAQRKVDSLVWRKPELARLRSAILAGNAMLLLDDAGRPVRIMF